MPEELECAVGYLDRRLNKSYGIQASFEMIFLKMLLALLGLPVESTKIESLLTLKKLW
jgi:hypothetical protein